MILNLITRVHVLATGCGRGCFGWISPAGRGGVGSSQVWAGVLLRAPGGHSRCSGPQLPSWRARGRAFAQGLQSWTVGRSRFGRKNSGLRPRPAAACVQVKLDGTQRKNKRLDFILLLRRYCCFPGVVNELCWLMLRFLSKNSIPFIGTDCFIIFGYLIMVIWS